MPQKGNIALILLIIFLIAGLAVGVFLVSRKTTWFSKAESPKASISPSSSAALQDLPATTSKNNYDNPFTDTEAYENPFNDL